MLANYGFASLKKFLKQDNVNEEIQTPKVVEYALVDFCDYVQLILS